MYRPKMRYGAPGWTNPAGHRGAWQLAGPRHRCVQRFLEGRFRDYFKLLGTPLKIEMRSGRNPFTDKEE